MTTKLRTLEEIADWLHDAVRRPGRYERKPDGFNRDLIVAALREAADAARHAGELDSWNLAHQLRACGHSRADWQDHNYPASEQSYNPDTKTSNPPMGYRCVACESIAAARQEEREALRGIVEDSLGGFAVAHPAAMGSYQSIMSALSARSRGEGPHP